ncbi:two-component response regulator [Minicystis rosea]|nr:two-component response regulator [Minicystis rosea]
MVRILYVEDDERLHRVVPGLVDGLAFSWTCAVSIGEALDRLDAADPDLVLTDLGLPDGEGETLIERIVARRPGLPIVVLTVASTERRVLAAIRAGACGYVLKEDLGKRLPSALVEALSGGVPMSPVAARAVIAQVRGSASAPPLPRPEPGGKSELSPREREVVEQLGRGLTYEQVAIVLGVSINTVRTHVRTVYESSAPPPRRRR